MEPDHLEDKHLIFCMMILKGFVLKGIHVRKSRHLHFSVSFKGTRYPSHVQNSYNLYAALAIERTSWGHLMNVLAWRLHNSPSCLNVCQKPSIWSLQVGKDGKSTRIGFVEVLVKRAAKGPAFASLWFNEPEGLTPAGPDFSAWNEDTMMDIYLMEIWLKGNAL